MISNSPTDPQTSVPAGVPAEPPAAPIAEVAPPAVEAPAAAPVEQMIGRFTLAQLEAMKGKRGRKPAEFLVAFPDLAAKPAAKAKTMAEATPRAKPARAAKRAASKPRQPRIPAVSGAILGDQTIDELLELIGKSGKKPAAFTILQRAAQVFVDFGAVKLPVVKAAAVATVKSKPGRKPKPVAIDPLAARLSAASKKTRTAVAALLALNRGR